MIKRCCQSQRQCGRGFGFERKISERVSHQRLIDEFLAKCAPLMGVVERQRNGLPHQARRAKRAVDARYCAHFENRCDAASGLADRQRESFVEFHFAAGIGAIAELILEPLNRDRVALTATFLVVQIARQKETTEAVFGLRQHQKRIAHRC